MTRRTRFPWELCPQNTFSGIHTWMLDYPLQKDGSRDMKAARTAHCHVCGQRPDPLHRADVDAMLHEAYDREAANERVRANLRALNPRPRR